MNARYLLGLALAAAAAVAACGSPDSGLLQSDRGTGDDSSNKKPGSGTATPGGTDNTAAAGTLPTNSKAGKAFFIATIDPILDMKCSGCHNAGGIGNPSWVAKGDASKMYDLIYLNGFAVANSRIVIKGAHSNGGAPELTTDDKSKFAQWISMETADGSASSQTSVLEKFGTCFDKTKFDAIGLGTLRTIRRTPQNNPTAQTENANNCTGCDAAPCRTCHSADEVTGFINAIGNPIFDADYTFEQSKLLNPAYIRQYVSTTPTGEPTFNPGLMTKSTAVTTLGKAYSHPMFTITPTMQAAIQDFVQDAITKQKAGTCGK